MNIFIKIKWELEEENSIYKFTYNILSKILDINICYIFINEKHSFYLLNGWIYYKIFIILFLITNFYKKQLKIKNEKNIVILQIMDVYSVILF